MRTSITHKFVEFIPDALQEGVLYISLEYANAVHRCFCGCGREVVTPISPTDWSISVVGGNVSLAPSIGNWSFPCRSHYWIRKNRVQWCGDMPQSLINAGRARDKIAKAAYYANRANAVNTNAETEVQPREQQQTFGRKTGFFRAFITWLKGGK
nr:DUF6527 family protein [uncultured Rhodoferax sp.]